MNLQKIQIKTSGEKFYNITDSVKNALSELNPKKVSGMLYLFVMHTSCGLTLNESFDPSAKEDMENFLKHIAKRNLPFITHTAEGEDDSPSHMKTMVVGQNLTFMVEKELVLGTWQGIYLCEFRDLPKTREVVIKFIKD